ncbi:MAG: glycosyltransferase [bacterium]
MSTFDEALSRRYYAGSDFFLMPSRFEPCGLSQLIAMRYGSIPIVRRTGGLADTVVEGVTGLTFFDPTPAHLLDAVHRALALSPAERAAVQAAGMATDWSWDQAAIAYDHLYQDLLPGDIAR